MTDLARSLIDSLADGLVVTDERGEVVEINPAARLLLGLPAGEPITAAYLKEHVGFYPFDLVGDSPAREELRVGERTLHSTISPLRDAAGRRCGVAVLLREVRPDEREDRHALFTDLSHELRTPLTSLAGAVDILLKEAASDRQRRYLHMARDACARMRTTIDDLVEVPGEGRPRVEHRPLILDQLVAESVERFRAAAEQKHAELTLAVEPPPAGGGYRLLGDRARLGQVVSNLLTNAIKFAPEGGRIDVEVFGPRVASGEVGLSVANNGPSLGATDRARAFESLEPGGDAQALGPALGLAASRTIIEGHGGRIWAEDVAQGARFVATLPAAPLVDPEENAAPASGRLALVVEDDRAAAYVLKGMLLAAGLRADVAHDAEEAIAIARERRPDLVTVDIRMPGVDGLALVEILKHDPDTRRAAVVVVSGVGDRERSLASGADAFFAKPIDVDAFFAGCVRLLAERERENARRVLVVDDDAGVRTICREVLARSGYVVREAEDGTAGLAEAPGFRPDLVLLDVIMPGADGFSVAERMRADPALATTPIIFLSARGQTADKVRAFKLGADDYLVKPFDAAELVARVDKAVERRARAIATSPTTRLPGADAIEAEVGRRLREGARFAFCYVDLDNLKAFNDYYGYAKADGVIRQTGDLLRETVRATGDFIGHIAGDDFVFVTELERVDELGRALCLGFDRLIPLYYNRADRDRGYIEAVDRYGQLRRFRMMSVSVAALTVDPSGVANYADLSAAAAGAKKLAKSIEGSAFVRDGAVVWPAPSPGPAAGA